MDSAAETWINLDELLGDLQPTPIQDANLPLRTKLLHADPQTRASCLLVEFPAGWQRSAGAFTCAEHAVILDGEIILDGDHWGPGQGFVVPAEVGRTETRAPNGALAVAWFSGAPRWTSGEDTSGVGAAGKGSSIQWSGDAPAGESDELDASQRKWRHNPEASLEKKSGIFVYSWPTP